MTPHTSHGELAIIGLGIVIPDHITHQAHSVLSRCSKLYSIVQEPTRLWLPPERAENVDVIDALTFYTEGALRTANYTRVAEAILASVSNSQMVGYVTYGNPMSYDSVAQHLVLCGRRGGVQVTIVPGVSSFDTVMCDIGIDMAPAIQVFEASWLLACDIRPRCDVHALLMQMGSFGSLKAHYTIRRDGSSLADLVAHLSSIYPASHAVKLVRSSASESQPALITDICLSNLCSATPDQLSGASLYIPAIQQPRVNDQIIGKMVHN